MKNFDYLSLSGQHLLIFVTLHELGTVTATAEKLWMTQSAVSHSLQKLRQIFDDELFVRAGRSIAPTLRSQQLYPEIKSVLQRLDGLTQAQVFDPASAQIAYKISANDYQCEMFLPQLYAQVSPHVQQLSLHISPSGVPDVELLRSADVDLVFSPFAPDHTDVMATRIFSDVARCFYDERVRASPDSLADFHTANYVGLTFTAGTSIDRGKNETRDCIDRNTLVRVPSFSDIPMFVRGSSLLSVAPGKLQDGCFQGLASVALPYDAPTINMYMLWHKKYQSDPQHEWFRQQVKACTQHLRKR